MKLRCGLSGKRFAFSLTLFVLPFLAACGTLEMGNNSPTPDLNYQATVAALVEEAYFGTKAAVQVTPSPLPATGVPEGTGLLPQETPLANTGWQTYSNDTFGIRLEHPIGWRYDPGYDAKLAGEDGFFQISAMGGGGATLDEAARMEANHHLMPYGSQPIIESLHVRGQEARLIWPSADQQMGPGGQAMLIVRYPRPVEIVGAIYEFFVLWADLDHIQAIALTLDFTE